jgi:hypothetical protein
MSGFYNTTDKAMEEFSRLRPDASEQAVKRNRGRINAHLSRDYSGGVGLKKIGLKVQDTKNFIEFYINPEHSDRVDVEFNIAVLSQNGWEVFDSEEAKGNNEFMVGQASYEQAKNEIKQKHLQEKRDEDESIQD